MGKSATKPIKYWGLWVSDFYISDSILGGKPIGRHCQLMAVTSFTSLHNGTVMVHGWKLGVKEGSRVSVHRTLDGMHFYMSQLEAQQAAANIKTMDSKSHRIVVIAERNWKEAKHNQKMAAMSEASRHVIQPIELESF